MSHDLRVALMGYGLAGEFFHAPLLATTPGMRLAAIVTANRERAQNAARAHPDAAIVAGSEDLWRDAAAYDVVVIATPNRTHVPLALQALEAGLHVVVDKPLAPTAAEGMRLLDAARARQRLLTVFHNRRWDGDFLTVRKLLDRDALGRVSRFESRFERWRPVLKPGWRQDPDAEAAGGVLFDLGSHLIDQALVLFGPVLTVYAELDRRNAHSLVDDDAFVALTHASGTRSHLWMSTMAAQSGPRIRLLGDRAGFTKFGLDVQEAALRSGASPTDPNWGREEEAAWGTLGTDETFERVPTERGAYPDFYRGVVAALRDGAPPPVDAVDAVEVIRIIEAARRSASSNTVMPVNPQN